MQGLKSSFPSWEQRCNFGLLPANLSIQTLEYIDLTTVISIKKVVFLPGKINPSWEQCSRAPYTFQALCQCLLN